MAIEFEDLQPAKDPAAARRARGGFSFGARVGSADRMLFTERLALLLETGVPLHAALRALQEQADKPAVAAIIGDMAQAIVGGERFSDALARHPQLFPLTYVNLVGASEAGGFLPEVLAQLVEMDEKQERLRATIVSALSYPGFLLVFSVLVVIFILTVVFPKFAVMFAGIYHKLPLSTKVLMVISEVLVAHGGKLLLGFGLLLVLALAGLRQPGGQAWLDRLKLRIPFVRDIFIKIYLERLMRVMGASLERGVTILATLAACRNVVPNLEFQRFLAELEIQITEGRGIAAGFTESPLVPANVKQMVATGEQTGALGRVMGRVADFYERDLTRQLNRLAKLAEPVMLLVMGVLVGTIVTSIILPIFKMSSR